MEWMRRREGAGGYVHMGEKHGAGQDRTRRLDGWMQTARHATPRWRTRAVADVAAVLRGDGRGRGEAAELSSVCPWTAAAAAACCTSTKCRYHIIIMYDARPMLGLLPPTGHSPTLQVADVSMYVPCLCGVCGLYVWTYTDNPTYAPACPDLHDRLPLSTRF